MANLVEFYDNSEAKILELTSEDAQWVDKAFYYPNDKDYFYRLVDGEMKKYGSGEGVSGGVGVKLNSLVIGGVKNVIEAYDILDIPENYEYNCVKLLTYGTINNYGTINTLH